MVAVPGSYKSHAGIRERNCEMVTLSGPDPVVHVGVIAFQMRRKTFLASTASVDGRGEERAIWKAEI